MIDLKSKAKNLIVEMRPNPKMYAITKEAFVMRVSTCLELIITDFDFIKMYKNFLHNDHASKFEDAWAIEVIDYALDLLNNIEKANLTLQCIED